VVVLTLDTQHGGASSPWGASDGVAVSQKTCEGAWSAWREAGRPRQTVGLRVGRSDAHGSQERHHVLGLARARGVVDGVTRAQAELVDAA